MPSPRLAHPGPPLAHGPQRRRASRDHRASRAPGALTRVFPRGTAFLVAALLLAGTGTARARVVPGPGDAASRGSTPSGGSGAADVEAAARRSGPGAAPSWRVRTAPGGWPLRPEPDVVAEFAPPPVAWAAGHRGVDLLGRPGQQVRAARAGTVTFTGRIAGRGVVVVAHGGTRTTYEPVAASVRRGEPVARGAALGRLELLGSHCLPRACLHWGLVHGETYLDPLTLVGRGPVRLLPWDGLPGTARRGVAPEQADHP